MLIRIRAGLIFSDVINSTNSSYNLNDIKNFLIKSVEAFQEIFKFESVPFFISKKYSNFFFKFLGDGVFFIIFIPYKKDEFINLAVLYHENLKKKIKIPFRTVATIGEVYCFKYYFENCLLYECLGESINFLIKKSKQIKDFKFL